MSKPFELAEGARRALLEIADRIDQCAGYDDAFHWDSDADAQTLRNIANSPGRPMNAPKDVLEVRNDCVCGETNARNCPVHQSETKPTQEEAQIMQALWDAGFSGPQAAEHGPVMRKIFELINDAHDRAVKAMQAELMLIPFYKKAYKELQARYDEAIKSWPKVVDSVPYANMINRETLEKKIAELEQQLAHTEPKDGG